MGVKLVVRQMSDVSIVYVTGRLTLAFLPDDGRGGKRKVDPECGSIRLRDELLNLVASGKRQILLNLGEVSYIDASGIGELVSGFTILTNNGGRLKLTNLTKQVQDLLQITKLYTVFDVFEDEATAIRSFC